MKKPSQGLKRTFRAVDKHPPPLSTEKRRRWIWVCDASKPPGQRSQLGIYLGHGLFRLFGGDRRQLELYNITHWAPLFEEEPDPEEATTTGEPHEHRGHDAAS